MILKPIAGKEVLHEDHRHPYHHGIGDAQPVIAGEAIATEDDTANDGLQQIVGETHATKVGNESCTSISGEMLTARGYDGKEELSGSPGAT